MQHKDDLGSSAKLTFAVMRDGRITAKYLVLSFDISFKHLYEPFSVVL